MVLLYLRTIRRIRIESFYLTIRTRTGAACIDKVTVFCTESEVTKMQNAPAVELFLYLNVTCNPEGCFCQRTMELPVLYLLGGKVKARKSPFSFGTCPSLLLTCCEANPEKYHQQQGQPKIGRCTVLPLLLQSGTISASVFCSGIETADRPRSARSYLASIRN